jgi:type IV secretory pathway protease TraF
MTDPKAAWIVAAVTAGLGLAAGLRRTGPPLLLVNESRSTPPGLYVLSAKAPDPGRLVAVAQPVAARSYLRALGVPPGMPLLKRVAAAGGARVCAEGGRMRWPGGTVAILDHDRSGRGLPHWSGCRRLAPGERLLVGDTATSFDSRYFGPAPGAAVIGVYRAVWTW